WNWNLTRGLESRASGARGELEGSAVSYNRLMPIFEYRCDDCGKKFETFVTAERTPECPGCRSANLETVLSSPERVGRGTGRAESAQLPMTGGCGIGTCGCRPH